MLLEYYLTHMPKTYVELMMFSPNFHEKIQIETIYFSYFLSKGKFEIKASNN